MEELGVALLTDHSHSKIIVSSRNHGALLGMGVSENSRITIGDLVQEKSWDLFAHHAFPYNNGNLPANIDEKTAKLLCAKCGGLPLAIKVIGRSMADIIDAREWEWAVKSQQHADLYDRLRWSYDSLGNYHVNLQLCFLYLAVAFFEDEVVSVVGDVIPLWLGEGLLARKKPQDQPGHEDPLEVGRIYVKVLADRCLIEPILTDIDGRVLRFRVHDVMRGLAIQIAEVEENFYCRAGKGLKVFTQNEGSGCTRILLRGNELSSLPESWRAPKICALLMAGNPLTEIPRKVIGSMISLKVLDLSHTSVQSLPESVGGLKQLVCLMLAGVPIKRLPASLTTLANLQILNLTRSSITELPSDIDRLRCLRYLSMYHCDDLQCLPCSISGLTSLQKLDMSYCSKVWDKKRRLKKMASITNLSTLTQLKVLRVQNNGETISRETFGSMLQMEALQLQLTLMTDLPDDIFNMSKLRRFSLECSHVVRMESKFSKFHNLTQFQLWSCSTLEDLPDLHKLSSLKYLVIFNCPKLKKFPREFTELGAFPSLEIFSLVYLDELEELLPIKEGAMPMLKVFTMVECIVLQLLPESYLNLKTLQKIRVYGCPMVSENLQKIKMVNTKVEVVTMSSADTQEIRKKFSQLRDSKEGYSYGELWCKEFWVFLQELYRTL
jgi:disease resistance protein RPS2